MWELPRAKQVTRPSVAFFPRHSEEYGGWVTGDADPLLAEGVFQRRWDHVRFRPWGWVLRTLPMQLIIFSLYSRSRETSHGYCLHPAAGVPTRAEIGRSSLARTRKSDFEIHRVDRSVLRFVLREKCIAHGAAVRRAWPGIEIRVSAVRIINCEMMSNWRSLQCNCVILIFLLISCDILTFYKNMYYKRLQLLIVTYRHFVFLFTRRPRVAYNFNSGFNMCKLFSLLEIIDVCISLLNRQFWSPVCDTSVCLIYVMFRTERVFRREIRKGTCHKL